VTEDLDNGEVEDVNDVMDDMADDIPEDL